MKNKNHFKTKIQIWRQLMNAHKILNDTIALRIFNFQSIVWFLLVNIMSVNVMSDERF